MHGSAYESAKAEPFPSSLREAIVNWERSEFAQQALGEQVWSHYLNFGKGEQRSFDAAVTDWERHRYFERG